MYNTKNDHFSPKNKAVYLWKQERKCKIIKKRPTASLDKEMEAFDQI